MCRIFIERPEIELPCSIDFKWIHVDFSFQINQVPIVYQMFHTDSHTIDQNKMKSE